NAPSFVQPTEQVKTLKPSVKPIETSIPVANHKTAIPKPKTHGNSKNRKACFVCKSLTHLIKDCDYYEKKMAQTPARNHAQRGNHQQYARMTHPNPQRHVVPTTVLTRSNLVPLTAGRPVTTAIPKPYVTRPRPAKTIFTKPHSPLRRNINRRPSPKPSTFPLKFTTIKALMVNTVKGVQGNWGNPQHALKDKGVIDSGCSRYMTRNMSYLSNFEEINGGYVAFGGNPKGGKISGKGKIKTGKVDFDDVYFVKELKFNLFSVSQMCDKKNNVLFIDTECIVLSPEFKLSDENQVLLRVPRENNMYNVDLKNIVPSGYLTYLFAKETLDESNLWHRRLGHNRVLVTKPHNKTPYELLLGKTPSIGFMRPFGCPVTILNTLDPLGKFDGKADEGFLVGYFVNSKAFRVFNSRTRIVQETLHINFLENKPNVAERVGEDNVQQYVLFPLWSSGSKNPQNTDGDAAFEVKELEFEGKKPESEVHVSPSSSTQTKKHDDKTKREAKGKSHVELSTRYRNLSVEFEDFSDTNINEVNAADSPVPAIEKISTNNTNTFSATGPYNTDVSPTHGKYLYMDSSQYLDDPNMPALEDITYSDDKEDVDAEAGFTNLETTITVSSIPTTRVHKDHHVTQIIGDLSSATQTRSMTRVIKDQGGLTQINNEDFHTCMFSYFLSQEEPKRIRQALKDPSWIEAMQKPDGIFISQDKYVAEILRKLGLTDGKSASTPIDTEKPLLKDPDGEDVDVHTYRSMIGSLMYLTSSRPDIMFAVCVNVVMRLQALIDRKKVIITEATIREALRLDDAKSIDCLPDEEIFIELSRMGTSWNEFSSSMALAVICLSTGNGFSGVETPLFEGMIVTQQADDVADEGAAVVTAAAAATIIAATTPITNVTLTVAPSVARRRKGVVIRDPEETSTPSIIIHSEPKSKDKGKGIMVEEPKPLKNTEKGERRQCCVEVSSIKEEATDKSPSQKNMMIYLRNMVGFKMDYFKRMSYDDIRLIFKKYFNLNVAFLEKTKEQLEEEESRELKRKTKSPKEKAVKKQKLDEEVEELKKHLQIMLNNDDDVYTEATPLSLKVPVVDYEIYTENNKPYFKIIRADGTHQLFLSLLRKIDREDLEVLWQIVKERFASSKPKNFSDDFLLTTPTYMFEKPDVEAQV
nr:ribonuclease H-like domain-containing protein [Tanacetum cinerariifolium]